MPRLTRLVRVFAFLEAHMKAPVILKVVAVVLFSLAAAGMWGAPLVPLGLAMWCLSSLIA